MANSPKVKKIAARVLKSGNPLDEDADLRAAIGQAIYSHLETYTGRLARQDGSTPAMPFDPAAITDAISPILAPLIADMHSMAGSIMGEE